MNIRKLVVLTVIALIFIQAGLAQESLETVSLEMNLSSDKDIYVDGSPASEKTYTESEINFPYITSNQPAGIVSFGELKNISYSETANKKTLKVTQTDGSFLLPNTRGGYTEIEDDEEDVKSRSFLDRVKPSFAYTPVEEPNVRVILQPDVEVEGFKDRIKAPVEIFVRHKINSGSEPEVELGPN